LSGVGTQRVIFDATGKLALSRAGTGTVMEFKLLGTLDVSLDGRRAALPARAKERCLLAVLLMNAGKTVPAGELVRCVWDGDDPPEGTFRSYLAHVREFLAAADGGARLAREDGGYRLVVDPDSIDLHRFHRLQEQAAAKAKAGNADEAVALLCEAEALWRGPALGGLPGRWVSAIRASLEEERLACVKRRAGLELDLGHHAELAGELRRLSARYPLDEALIAYELTALYRSGRQADALALYRQARSRLLGQGIEPGPELAALHQHILRQDLQPPRIGVRRRLTVTGQPATVPLPTGAFVGRASELRALTSAGPGAAQVAVISGMPGVGKTRLAVEAAVRVADRYPDGQLYLEFHAHQAGVAPLSIDEALRRLLEMAGAGLPPVPQNRRELTALWRSELEASRFFVILDDVPDADVITPLLPTAGQSAVLITTRQLLPGIPDAAVLSLGVLPERDAVTLFTVTAGPESSRDPDAVSQIVRSFGCLPLAVALAASRLREDGGPATTGELIAEITESGVLPAGASRASKQLLSALETSYKGLSESQQRFFRLLGKSPCMTFTAESAAAIAGVSAASAREMTAALLDRHLAEHGARDRIRLHDVLRSYAALCAERDSPVRERREAGRRLLDYYLSAARHADRQLYPHHEHTTSRSVPHAGAIEGESPESSLEWLEAEWRNIIKAADYAARHEWKRECAELAHLLSEFLDIRGCWEEALSLHTLALRACRDLGDQRLIATALIDLSRACQQKGMHHAALAHAQQALEASQSVGDQHGAAIAADRMGVICYYAGHFREALAHKQEARLLYAESGDPAGEAEAIFHCGVSSLNLGRLDESLQHFHQALGFFRQSGNLHWAAKTLNSIAEASRRQGYHREALEDYHKALSIYRAMGARPEHATVMQNIGQVHLYKGDPERALTEFRYALATYREIRDLPGQARAMCDLGDAYLAMDDHSQCLVYYQKAASTAEEVGDLYARAIALRGSGDGHRLCDHPDEAMRYYTDALKIVQEIEEPYQHALILDGMAETMLRAGRHSAWRIYLRQALDLYKTAGAVEAATAEIRLEALNGPPGDALSPSPAGAFTPCCRRQQGADKSEFLLIKRQARAPGASRSAKAAAGARPRPRLLRRRLPAVPPVAGDAQSESSSPACPLFM
jgi:DNA-binding SARP family transcriptional activator